MRRYIEMGFSEAAAAEAVDRFGDNLHNGCHWLMTRETVGQIPKRLCLKKENVTETYYGSEVKFDGVVWKVDDFDKKHALIRVQSHGLVRWEHISDARIEWVVIHHNQPQVIVPSVNWKRKVGSLIIPSGWYSGETELNTENALSMYLSCGHGRQAPVQSNPARAYFSLMLWRSLTKLSTVIKHTPSRPPPRSVNSRGVHDFRIEWMTYFTALCDVYGIDEQVFTTTLYDKDIATVLALFPTEIHTTLEPQLNHWNVPQPYLELQRQQWNAECLPLVELKCSHVEGGQIHLSVFFNDMTFVKIPNMDTAHLQKQFQYLFYKLFNLEQPIQNQIILDRAQLQKTLKKSKKKHNDSISPVGFATELFPYQKVTLSWLTEREKSKSTSLWGWNRHQLEDGFTFHTSVFGNLSYTLPTAAVRGGILAQDVGMGKTVEMLALIASAPVSGPTLIIMPTTMLSVWMVEAKKHVPSLKTVKFHGARRSLSSIKNADIVCTTYRIVANESRNHVPTLGTIRWGRIILDESHELKNLNSVTTKAVCNLHAPLKWCISATPWAAVVENIFPYMAFFNVSSFLQNIQLPSTRSTSPMYLTTLATHYLCEMLSSITWWQQKRHIRLNLPTVTNNLVKCDLNQGRGYTHLVNAIRTRIKSNGESRRSHLLYYTWLLKIAAIDLSLVPLASFGTFSTRNVHHSESKTIEAFVASLGTSTYDSSVRTLINSWSDGNVTCSICMDVMERPTLTPCHHMFCFECIQSAYQHDSDHKCPLCRTHAGTTCLKELTQEVVEETVENTWYTTDVGGTRVEMPMETKMEIMSDCNVTSSKIQTLIQLVQAKGKTVVFTQYHIASSALCVELLKRNIKFVSIQGRMSPKQRQTAIDSFQQNMDVQVFVMTLKTAAVGITLTAAASVVFLEPVNSKALRKQAVGRVWRIGQTRPITVTTLVTHNTIDTCTREELLADNTVPR